MTIPIGTEIRFVKNLEERASEEHPDIVYAVRGEHGVITGHGTKEGYWVKADRCRNSFGASEDEFEVINP